MSDDAELLRRYADTGSEKAFAELVRRWLNLVYSVALRQVNGRQDIAKDVCQAVFSDLAKKAATLSERSVLSGWLYRSARFAASDAIRSERRRRIREMEAQLMHELTTVAARDDDWCQLRPVLDDAMAELDGSDRDAVMLRYFESHNFREIGAMLHLSEDAARMRVERALRKLRLLLARRGIISTTSALGLALPSQMMTAAPASWAEEISRFALLSAGSAGAGATTGVLFIGLKTFAVGAVVLVLGLVWIWSQSDRHQSSRSTFAATVSTPALTPNRPELAIATPTALTSSQVESQSSPESTVAMMINLLKEGRYSEYFLKLASPSRLASLSDEQTAAMIQQMREALVPGSPKQREVKRFVDAIEAAKHEPPRYDESGNRATFHLRFRPDGAEPPAAYTFTLSQEDGLWYVW